MKAVGKHLKQQWELEYNLKAEIVHRIVMLHFKYFLSVPVISYLVNIPETDIETVIEQELINVTEARKLMRQIEFREKEHYIRELIL